MLVERRVFGEMEIFANHHNQDGRYSLPHPLIRFFHFPRTYQLSSSSPPSIEETCTNLQQPKTSGMSSLASSQLSSSKPHKPPKKKKAPQIPLRQARPPNHLLSFLPYPSSASSLSSQIQDAITTDGYIVIPAVITSDECASLLGELWSYMSTTSPTLNPNTPDSWYPDNSAATSADPPPTDSPPKPPLDPWVHSGLGNLPDMTQSYSAGWVFTSLRDLLATRVFEPLYNTAALHSSKEGFTFHRPTCPSLVSDPSRFAHPNLNKPRPRVCGKPSNTSGEHFDQRALDVGLQCIQSSTALIDQSEDSGCFMCWPGSHVLHAEMTANIYRARNDWVALTDTELQFLRDNDFSPKRVPVNAGDVILWRSDLCHCGVGPQKPMDTFRAVSYTCMLPAALTDNYNTEEQLQRKYREYCETLTGDHRPDLAEMPHLQAPKGDNKFFPYFTEPPLLTYRQAELYGLVKYEDDQTAKDEQRELAIKRGVNII